MTEYRVGECLPMFYRPLPAFAIMPQYSDGGGRATPMSIYPTVWCLKFPRYGDYDPGCESIEVVAQGVPAHIGSAVLDSGYADGDPYASFLPPAITVLPEDEERALRAVVFVIGGMPKGTKRSGQEYVRPQVIGEWWGPDGRGRVMFEDGSTRDVGAE